MRRLAILLAACVAFTTVLSGCTWLGVPASGAYDKVRPIVERLDLPSKGEVAFETFYGGGIVGEPASYMAIIDGDVTDEVEASLAEDGFTVASEPSQTDSDTTWDLTLDGDKFIATIRPVDAGTTVHPPSGDEYELQHDSTIFFLY